MSKPIWKIVCKAADGFTDVVNRTWPDGRQESCFVTTPEFKKEINEETAQLQDADGNTMTAAEAKAFVATLP